ncbi:Serine/threonine-protein kinase RAD53 like [Verticillium longisporum]|nr:Serine/threonine-protein kinase RAD53 like [Verticillium longisporum]
MKELEAIAKFSQPNYAPFFVRTRGWFENAESVFITMEYYPLGDLRRFMDSQSPFPENLTSHIVRQLTRGINYMHASGFAHRDLKPANILVASTSPRWSVRIADFGISKQALEGGTYLRTMHIGTFGYMAPEVLGFNAQNNPSAAYSVTVDMWAIGVIALELLMKRHPFPNVSDLVGHVHGTRTVQYDGVFGVHPSDACRDFIGGLLTPHPAMRPSASVAVKHPWLKEIKVEIVDSEDDEPLFVEDHPQDEDITMRHRDAVTPASLPSLAWSNLRLTAGAPASDAGTLMSTQAGLQLDRSGLLPSFQALSLETTRYFVLRSDNQTDIETSIAHGIWTSSPRVNKIIEKGHTRSGGKVVFFFSVIKSQRFCGVAQMTSPMDWNHTDEHWVEDSWRGRFTVDWLCWTELSFSKVKHVPVSQRTPEPSKYGAMHLEISVIAGLVLAVGSTRSALDVGLSPLRIFLLAFIAQYSLFKAYRVFVYPRYVSGLRHLPGPTDGHFFIGQMAKQLLTPGPVDIFLDWMRKWPDEPLIRYLSIGNSETIMVNSPAVLKEMQQTKSYSFCKPKIAARMFSPITGHGILFAEGDIHKRQRNQLSRPFSLSNVKKLLPVLQGKARELCAALGRDMGPDAAKAVTVEPFFQKAALDVLAIASIGYDLGSLSTASACFHAVYDRIIHQPRLGHVLTFLDGHVPLRAWLPLPLNRRWLRDNALIRQMLLGKLQLQKRRVLRRREGPDEGPDKGPDKGDHVPSGQGRDLLSFILEECRGSPGQENWDDQELLDFVLNFIAGGHETIGTALTWASHVLSTRSDVQAQLHAEVEALYRGKPEAAWNPQYAEIESLRHLNNFVRELLRVYSPALFLPREASEDVTLANTLIPKGTLVVIVPAVTHFNTQIWGPDAEAFRPGRWDERGEKGEPGLGSDPYAFVPFLHGPRGCIGKAFAMITLKVMIIEMVREFGFTTPPGQNGVVEYANPNFTLRPKDNLRVVVEKRHMSDVVGGTR